MMNQELKIKWVEALRSGRYRQGSGSLRRAGKYCCLGVLCEISGEGSWNPRVVGGISCDMFTYNDQHAGCYLPKNFEERCGITKQHTIKLADMNDTEMASFSKIADYIEKNL